MSDRKRVIAAYQDKDGTCVVVLDDGAHMEWSQPDGAWVRWLPPLPPEALGEVASGADEIDERKPDDSPDVFPMVPGMMRLVTCKGTTYAKIAAIGFIVRNDEGGTNVFLDISPRESFADKRDVPEFLAAYTDARDHTIRHDERTREEVRRASEPEVQTILREDVEGAAERLAKLPTVKPDLAEWPGRPEAPPDDHSTVEVLTQHGLCFGFYNVRTQRWFLFSRAGWVCVDAGQITRWRIATAYAIVDKDGRVTGVIRG